MGGGILLWLSSCYPTKIVYKDIYEASLKIKSWIFVLALKCGYPLSTLVRCEYHTNLQNLQLVTILKLLHSPHYYIHRRWNTKIKILKFIVWAWFLSPIKLFKKKTSYSLFYLSLSIYVSLSLFTLFLFPLVYLDLRLYGILYF